MSELRNAMIDQMLLNGFSERTKKSYLNAVSLLARHYHLTPDKLSQSDIQNWFLYLVKERQLSAATCRLYLNAVNFFYLQVLHWPALQLELTTPKRKQRIPDLLSPNEVRTLIEAAAHPKYRTMFATCYACGLRVSELVALQVCHIHGEQMYLQVVQGKGFKDRNIPLSASLLQLLRDYWRTCHPACYLFTGHNPKAPIGLTSVQKYFTKTKREAAITKVGGIHSLRHAFASHQLAAGMPLHQLKELLGHTDLKSTERYLHWCPQTASAHYDLLAHVLEGQRHE
ncbi:MAG: site-specific integrase [Spirochaetales bacterium]|jgi:integrase/recombinase XerD|nr:site-specific integrase [Spirochaetales bacterium]